LKERKEDIFVKKSMFKNERPKFIEILPVQKGGEVEKKRRGTSD